MAVSTITARDKNFEENVRLHFRRGLSELASLSSCLLRAQEDPSIYAEIREHIEIASQELTSAEDLIQRELERVNSASLEMMALKKKLTDEQKRKKEDLATLRTHMKNSEKLLEEAKENYVMGENKMMLVKVFQRFAEAEAEIQQSLKTAALWLMLIPVAGTIVGGIVAIDAHIAMKRAEEKTAFAEDLIHYCRENKEKYQREAEKYAKLLEEQENSILGNEKRIQAIEEEKSKLAKVHEETLDLQEALRHCFLFVGTLAAKVNVADITSQYNCFYESLRAQLDDMNKHVLPLFCAKSTEDERLAILLPVSKQLS